MGYKEDNARKISEAFAKFQADAESSFRNGLEAVLDKGVELCLEEHKKNPIHPKDIERTTEWHSVHVERGGYGWILGHNGMEVKRKVYGDDSELTAKANEQLSYVLGKSAKEGWVGIILASLEPETYYNVLYEFIPMRAAIRDLKSEDFNKYFKPMNV